MKIQTSLKMRRLFIRLDQCYDPAIEVGAMEKQFKLGAAIPQLPTGDIEKTAAFFDEILGFEIVAKLSAQKFLIVRREAAEIHFWTTQTEAEARKLGNESSCYIRVENIEPFFHELQNRRAPFRYELTKQPWGMNEMQIDDPFGNAIRFGEQIC